MGTGPRYATAVAGLLGATLVSCAHGRQATVGEAAASPPAQETAQQQPQQEQQPQLQQQVGDAQRRLEAAHQDVVTAQQQLAAAQQREEQARANVQQLEIKARQDLARASQLAFQAEQAEGLRAATGRIAQATPSSVLLQLQDGRTMSFHVDDRTRVLVGSEQRSVSEIQQGANARVAYDPKGAEPTAVTIRVAPVGSDLGVNPASPSRPAEPVPPAQR
jgi:hypothetical protein